MRKLSPRYKKWLLHRVKYQLKRQKKHETYLKIIRQLSSQAGNDWNRQFVSALTPEERSNILTPAILKYGTRFNPPAEFCLTENFDETAQFLEEFREQTKNNLNNRRRLNKINNIYRIAKRTKYIDFRNITTISTSAALVLAAEFDRIRMLTNQPMFPIALEQWHPAVRNVLNSVGFLELLDAISEPPEAERTEETILKFLSGDTVVTARADQIVTAVNNLSKVLSESGEISLNGAVGEAMNNAVHHAYPDWHEFSYPVTQQWWMTGSANREKREMSVVIYDQGVTIPVHLPRRWGQDLLAWIPGGNRTKEDDGEMIKRATMVKQTSTGKRYHGNGFQDMKSAIEDSAWGRLRVLSRRGEYIYETGEPERCYTHNSSIGGTLIEWTVAAGRQE